MFSKKTIDTVAKRAAFRCSNPECNVSTVGPNSDPVKSTTIGEAAHIFGVKSGSARYSDLMSDFSRNEITNAIWLCRNCHKKIDRDEKAYPSDMLFEWRERHERYISKEIGKANDHIRENISDSKLVKFQGYPPIIKRIVIDQPPGWEWRLTSELMRHLNQPLLRRLHDLREDLYTHQLEHVDDDEAMSWVSSRISEMSVLISPLSKLFDRLNESWGIPGEPGNIEEILHVCLMLRDGLEQILHFEERIHFVRIPEEFERLVSLLKDCLGSQMGKVYDLPDELEKIVSMIGTDHGGTIEKPLIIKKSIEFALPAGWEEQVESELNRIVQENTPDEPKVGFFSNFLWGAALIWVLYMILF